MQIEMDSQYISFIAQEGEKLIGRLKANNSSNVFYIYDFGANPNDAKKSIRDRRKLGTILYSNENEGQKLDSNVEVYMPEIEDAKEGIKSWFDDNLKKENIGKELE